MDDAWWTGPLLASGASTLPKGRALIEPYLYDAKPYGVIDDKGKRHDAPDADSFGSQTYLLYGVTDTFTAGLIPRFGYRQAGGRSSSGVQLGDLTLQGQYRLTQYKEGGRTPTISLMLQETLPTGRHDKAGHRPNDGFGSGAYATTLGVNSQTYFWTPNGRILRTRLNLAYTVSGHADVEGKSVYGTPAGFTAAPSRATRSMSTWPSSTASPADGWRRSTWPISATRRPRCRASTARARPMRAARRSARP
jgi:hypothetical protein